MTVSRFKIGIIASLLFIMVACTPAEDENLPTLVRIPSETASAPAVGQSLATLPASFTPTLPPTLTATLHPSITPSLTPTVTVTPSSTITNTPSPTPTDLPTLSPDDRPILAVALTAAAATVLPQDYQVPNFGGPEITLMPQDTPTLQPGMPSPIPPLPTNGLPIAESCTSAPTGGFLPIYQGNPDIANQLGCASGVVQTVPAAWQNFETGIMVWLNGEVLVFYSVSDSYQTLPDTFIEGSDPETSSETPPSGLFTPIRGFLKIWDGNDTVRNGLGWARNNEQGVSATVQTFGNGRMIYLPGRTDILVLIGSTQSGTYLVFQGSY